MMRLELNLLLFVISLVNGYQNSKEPIGGYNSFLDTSTQNPMNALINPKWGEPYFDPTIPKNVTALIGKSAYLSCRVRNLGNKTVSWIRHRDIHILTVGTYTFTNDQRFQTAYHRDINEWTLQIKWAQKRDAGMYECQVSTQPIKSYSVRLNVVDINETTDYTKFYRTFNEDDDIQNDNYGDTSLSNYLNDNSIGLQRNNLPTATILGGPDMHVDHGSTINLTCAIRFSPEQPTYIYWRHKDKVISHDSLRERVSVRTEKGESTISYLLIKNADPSDSGNYSCSPSNTDVSGSIMVHVLNGERPEAMQTTGACRPVRVNLFIICLAIAINFMFSHHHMPLRKSLPLAHIDDR